MPLTDEERKAIVVYRLEKADGTCFEAFLEKLKSLNYGEA